MTPEREAELFLKLDMLTGMARTQTAEQAALRQRIEGLSQQVATLGGRIEEQSRWLQSMDARFTALMHPYEPRKPAAE